MTLTPATKQYIDSLTYEALLRRWRFAPVGDPWFEGQTGEYWSSRMAELRNENHATISKRIGWEQ